jgi:hypothetical protein
MKRFQAYFIRNVYSTFTLSDPQVTSCRLVTPCRLYYIIIGIKTYLKINFAVFGVRYFEPITPTEITILHRLKIPAARNNRLYTQVATADHNGRTVSGAYGYGTF